MKKTILFQFAAAVSLVLLHSAPLALADNVITESVGTVGEFSPDAIVIRSESAAAPVRYVVDRDITYVDEAGAPVSVDVIKSGLPVTVHYVREGDRTIARRVIVHRRAATTVTTAPVVTTTTTPVITRTPVVEERRTTTTTTTSGGK